MEPKNVNDIPFFCFYLPMNNKTSSLVDKIVKLIEKETTKNEKTDEENEENDENIKCEFCEKTFKRINGLTSHVKYCDKKQNSQEE